MTQYQQKANNTFVKGLITEAGPLTFPENASVDELNCDLLRDGSRRRRLGISYESGQGNLSFGIPVATTVSTGEWKNVGGVASVSFTVVQVGNKVGFFQQGTGALSASRVDTSYTSGTLYQLDISLYVRPASGADSSSAPIECVSINGALVIVSPEIEPLLVERDPSDGTFTVTQIVPRIRDFEWLGDVTAYSTSLATGSMTDTRQYDTLNSGWHGTKGTGAVTTYETAKTAWPALNLPWYSGKNSSGAFAVADWDNIEGGTSLVGNGHYILDLFSQDKHEASAADRTALGGTAIAWSDPGPDTEDARFSTAAAFAGRIFYAGMEDSTQGNSGNIFFSQILEHGFASIGECLSANDPTSETFSDLLDTDGGYIRIPEAYNIRKLHPFGPSLYVFAENGVWVVNGVDDVFRATEYSVNKITEVGLSSKRSFVSALGRPYWWSNLGIHTLEATESGSVAEKNMSIGTIQKFWTEISGAERDKAVGIYDGVNRRVFWFYPSLGETVANKRSKALLFDEVLEAFIPWEFSDALDGSYVIEGVFFSGEGSGDVEYTVVDSSGNEVIDAAGDTVIVTLEGRQFASSEIKLLVVDSSAASENYTFAEFTGIDFLDFGTSDYSSYAVGGYDFMGDMTVAKTAPYVNVYHGLTETGFTGNAVDGYTAIRGSSCLVSHFWDFKDYAAASTQQSYRLKYPVVVDENSLDTFDYPASTISTKLRLRGRGRSVRIKFESEQGKDFHLYGWDTIVARNERF